MKEFSAMLFAGALLIALAWFTGTERYGKLFAAPIEATKLSHSESPAPGDRN